MDGIWWILVTGAQWNQLPERYGKWNSVYRFHLRWARRGIFKSLFRKTAQYCNRDFFKIIDGSHIKVHQDACYPCQGLENQAFGKTKGGRNTKVHAMTNSDGKPLDFLLTAGNEHEIKTAMKLLGNLRDKVVLADRGYDSDELRRSVRKKRGVAIIPGRKNRKEAVFYLKEVGRKRYVVENYFSRIKRFRRIGTRYDRLPHTYEAFLSLVSLWEWLK